VEDFLSRAESMEKKIYSPPSRKPCVFASVFFEPSTRTNLSFQTAAKRLGCDVIAFAPETSSLAKGESFKDTMKIIDGYADILTVRHPLEGSARLAAEVCTHPVINAGDGGNQHPTQTLVDLYTIKKEKGDLKGLSIHLVGDLKHARTMRSLLYGLAMFGSKIKLVAPKGLEMDPSAISEAKEKFGAKIEESHELSLAACDVLYVCRVQKERFADPVEAERVQKEFRITEEQMKDAPKGLIIMHPLPRVDELSPELDATPRAKYFEQARHGVPVRMGVIEKLLER